jgi:hypothetical protein
MEFRCVVYEAMKRKKPLKKTPLRKVSPKLSKELKRYYVLREKFLRENPECMAGMSICCREESTQVHHKARRGKNLNKIETWMAVCGPCHEWIESHANTARELGWLLT